jgi:glycosyltransferase involved in cell wall biosynthesis
VQVFPCRGRFDKRTIGIIKEFVSREGVQILHSHNYKSNFYAWMVLSGNNVRWVATNHGRRTGYRLWIYNLLNLFILRRADAIVAVSEKIAGQMKHAGINKEKIRVIDNGIDLTRFTETKAKASIRESLGIRPDALIIGAVGSLTSEKGHQYLLRAAPKVIENIPRALFLFVGDGPERTRLGNMSSQLGIRDKVFFAGIRKDIPEILSILDVFVLPSLKEGLPMALLEAQAAKVPTVASNVGAIPDVMKDGVTGILAPPKDFEAIGQAIIRILSDQNAAFKMAGKGFEIVRDNFSSERMADKYLSVYWVLLNASHKIEAEFGK